jgi:hypothetical protein
VTVKVQAAGVSTILTLVFIRQHDVTSQNTMILVLSVIVCACNVIINLTAEDTRNKYRIWLKRNQMLGGCGFCAGITTP